MLASNESLLKKVKKALFTGPLFSCALLPNKRIFYFFKIRPKGRNHITDGVMDLNVHNKIFKTIP